MKADRISRTFHKQWSVVPQNLDIVRLNRPGMMLWTRQPGLVMTKQAKAVCYQMAKEDRSISIDPATSKELYNQGSQHLSFLTYTPILCCFYVCVGCFNEMLHCDAPAPLYCSTGMAKEVH